jgi:predicted dehydrogenase
MKLEPDPPIRCRDYRIGAIGAGFIMAEVQLEAYRLAGFPVVAIASRTVDKARAVAARRNIPRVHETPLDLAGTFPAFTRRLST